MISVSYLFEFDDENMNGIIKKTKEVIKNKYEDHDGNEEEPIKRGKIIEIIKPRLKTYIYGLGHSDDPNAVKPIFTIPKGQSW